MELPYSRGRHAQLAIIVTGLSHVPFFDTSQEVFPFAWFLIVKPCSFNMHAPHLFVPTL